MNLKAIMEEVAETLSGVTELRVHAYPVDALSTPAGVVAYPDGAGVTFHGTYGRNGQGDVMIPDLPVHLICQRVTDRAALDTVTAWLDESSATSAVSVLENRAWTTCDLVTVTTADFTTITIGTVEYLDVVLHLEVTVSG